MTTDRILVAEISYLLEYGHGHQLSWFDAHIWAYAEHYGPLEILTEDLQHNRTYGSVRAINPFV